MNGLKNCGTPIQWSVHSEKDQTLETCYKENEFQKQANRISLVFQLLGLCTLSLPRAWVQSLIIELRSHKTCSMAKNKINKQKPHQANKRLPSA